MDRVTQPDHPELPEHLAVDSLRASASLSDWATVKSVLHTAAPSQLRAVVVELLASEARYDWRASEAAYRRPR
jgi:hypothetical protein